MLLDVYCAAFFLEFILFDPNPEMQRTMIHLAVCIFFSIYTLIMLFMYVLKFNIEMCGQELSVRVMLVTKDLVFV